jgi:hypothetical protein
MRSLRKLLGAGAALALIWTLTPLDSHAYILVEDFSDGTGPGFDPAFGHSFSAISTNESHGFIDDSLAFPAGEWALALWSYQDYIAFTLAPDSPPDFASVIVVTFGDSLLEVLESFDTTGLGLDDIVSVDRSSSEVAFDDLVINAIPEPSTTSLLGLGLVGITAVRRRGGAA